MCVTCGCSDNAKATITDLDNDKVVILENPNKNHEHNHTHDDHEHNHGHSHHDHVHTHDHSQHDHTHGHVHDNSSYDHAHTHASLHGTTISLEAEILAKNDLLAERNRGWFDGKNILALNLVSSPGSGKTTLLERTITDLKDELPINVVEGDQETMNDAQRIKATGCRVVQINTGTGCHLEADMLARGIKELQPPANSVLMIENVGNLVCPALFDLGEKCKIAILSVTEGEDKPTKYPHMFRASDVMILNKIDLLPYLNFNVEDCIEYARTVNPNIKVFQLSAMSGEGMDDWYNWLKEQITSNTINEATA